jgi:hypothetical protein
MMMAAGYYIPSNVIMTTDIEESGTSTSAEKSADKDNMTLGVITGIVDRHILFKKNENADYLHGIIDNSFKLLDAPYGTWDFVYMAMGEDDSLKRRSMVLSLIGNEMTRKAGPDTKLTVVVDNESIFEYFRRFDHNLSFQGELSMALYDAESRQITDEFYLANYTRGDRSRELYLAGEHIKDEIWQETDATKEEPFIMDAVIYGRDTYIDCNEQIIRQLLDSESMVMADELAEELGDHDLRDDIAGFLTDTGNRSFISGLVQIDLGSILRVPSDNKAFPVCFNVSFTFDVDRFKDAFEKSFQEEIDEEMDNEEIEI